jgi:hypothetical protein
MIVFRRSRLVEMKLLLLANGAPLTMVLSLPTLEEGHADVFNVALRIIEYGPLAALVIAFTIYGPTIGSRWLAFLRDLRKFRRGE